MKLNCIEIKINGKVYELPIEKIYGKDESFSNFKYLTVDLSKDSDKELKDVIAKTLESKKVYDSSSIGKFIEKIKDEGAKKILKSLTENISNYQVVVDNKTTSVPKVVVYPELENGKVVGKKQVMLSKNVSTNDIVHEFLHLNFDYLIDNDTDFAVLVENVMNEVNNNLSEFSIKSEIKSIKEVIPTLFYNSSNIKALNTVKLKNGKPALTELVNLIAIPKGLSATKIRKALQIKKNPNSIELEGESFGTSFSKNGGDEDVFIPVDAVEPDDALEYKKRIQEQSEEVASNFLKRVVGLAGNLFNKVNFKLTSVDKLLDALKNNTQVFKMFDVFYNMPVYRVGKGYNNTINKDNEVFNNYLDSVKQNDLVKIPFLKWNNTTKEWEKSDKEGSMWFPVIHTITPMGLVKIAKPYKPKDKEFGRPMTIPYKFVEGIRTFAGDVQNVNTQNASEIWSDYAYDKEKKSNTGNNLYTSVTYSGSNTPFIAPSYKQFNVLSAKARTDKEDMRTIEKHDSAEKSVNTTEDAKTYEKTLPNTDLIRTLKVGDLVRVKMTNDEGKEWNLWKPVRNVGANGVEVVVGEGSNSFFYVSNDDISMVAINKSRTATPRYTAQEVIPKEISTKAGDKFVVKSLDNTIYHKEWVGRYSEDNLGELNKKRKEFGLPLLSKAEIKVKREQLLNSINVGDYVNIGININDKEVSTLQKVIATSKNKIYVTSNRKESSDAPVNIITADINEVNNIYKNVKEDVGNLKTLEKSLELLKSKDYKNKEHFNNQYIKENIIPGTGFEQIYNLKKGDLIIVEGFDSNGNPTTYYKVVSSVTEKGINIVTTYGKEINSENIKFERIAFDQVKDVAFKKISSLAKNMEELKRFRKKASSSPMKFTNRQKADNYLKFQKEVKNKKNLRINDDLELEYEFKGNYYPVPSLNKYYTIIPNAYTNKQLSNITRTNKRLVKGDIVKPTNSNYFSEIKSLEFDKKTGEFIGVNLLNGGESKVTKNDVAFTSFVKKDNIDKIGYSDFLYEERTSELYTDLGLQQKKSTREINTIISESKNSYTKSKKEDISLLLELANRLQAMNPNITINLITNAEMEAMGYTDTRGFVRGKEIFINTDLASRSDLLHEHGHILMSLVKVENPELYEEIVKKSLDSPLYDHFKTLYPELSDSALGEEIFISALDKNAKNQIFPPKTKSWWESIKNTVRNFFNSLKAGLKKLLGVPEKKSEIFDGLSIYTLLNTDLNSLVDVFGDKILNSTIEPSINNSVSKEIFNIGVNVGNMKTDQVKRLKEIMLSRVCLN
jgi:hypothetical protein